MQFANNLGYICIEMKTLSVACFISIGKKGQRPTQRRIWPTFFYAEPKRRSLEMVPTKG